VKIPTATVAMMKRVEPRQRSPSGGVVMVGGLVEKENVTEERGGVESDAGLGLERQEDLRTFTTS
jgi:hypothetical protein